MTTVGSRLSPQHKAAISRGLRRFHSVPEQSANWYEKFIETRLNNLYVNENFTRRKHVADDETVEKEPREEMPSHRRKNDEAETLDNIVSLADASAANGDGEYADGEYAEVIEVRYCCPLGEVSFEFGPGGTLYVSVPEGVAPNVALELTHKASAFVAKHNLFRRVT